MRWVIAATGWALALAGCGSGDLSADGLIGTWVSSDGVVSMEVTEDSMTSLVEEFIVESTYTATDTTLEVVDVSGEIACPPDQVGTYEWDIDEDDVLSLTIVSDEYGRKNTLDGITFEREE